MPRKKSDPRENKVSAKKHKSDPAMAKSGRPRKTKVKARRRKAPPAEALAARPVSRPGQKTWKWTKIKRKAVKLIIEGTTINDIAKSTGKHRNTIRRWMNTSEFVHELMQRLEEFKNSRRFRRLQLTSRTLDRIENIVEDQFKAREGEDETGTLYDGEVLSSWLKEWRQMRGEERRDFGDHVDKVEKTVGINITGGLAVGAIVKHERVSLGEAIKSAFPSGAIIEGESAEIATGNLLAKAVTTTGLIDKILEEDAVAMEAGND